jgi:hypothetical protein
MPPDVTTGDSQPPGRAYRPASLLLVHGAGSGPRIYDGWADEFPSMRVAAVDLHGSLDVYGRFPSGIRSRPESSLARAERKRGISVPALPWPALVIYGDEFRDERGTALVRLYRAEGRYFGGLDHWGLVLDRRVRRAVAEFLANRSLR